MGVLDRQASLSLDIPASVSIAGVGGVGSWAALFSAMIGVRNIVIFDSDVVEENNLNRTPFRPSDIGRLKVEALKELIQEYRPDCVVDCRKERVGGTSIFGTEYVLDGTDNLKSQKIIEKAAKDSKAQYIRCGYDVTSKDFLINVCSTNAKTWGDEQVVEGYSTPPAPSFVAPASIAGALAVLAMVKRIEPYCVLELKKLLKKEII